jgi:hypothetical protein
MLSTCRRGKTMARARKTDQEVKREVDQRLREIELLKREAQDQGLAFSSLGEEELTRKIHGESSGSR